MSYDLTIRGNETYSLTTPRARLNSLIARLPHVRRNGDRGFVLDEPPKRWMEIDLEAVSAEGDNIEEDGQTSADTNCVRLHIPHAFLGDALERDYLPTALAIADHIGWILYDDQTDGPVVMDAIKRNDKQGQPRTVFDREQLIGHWIAWPYEFDNTRAEFDILEDGRFEVTMFDEGGKVSAVATGSWDVLGTVIQWTYQSCRGFPRPRRPEQDKILHVDRDRFVLVGSCGIATEHWRGVKCNDASMELGLSEVQSFLDRLARLVQAGFTSREIAGLLKTIQELQPGKRLQAVFPITSRGVASPLYLGVALNDGGTLDICFSGPTDFVHAVADEIKRSAAEPAHGTVDHGAAV